MTPTAWELDQMHTLYRQGDQDRQMAPHIVYSDGVCPHVGCEQRMQAIDFRLEAHGRVLTTPWSAPGGTIQGSSVAILVVIAGSTSPSAPACCRPQEAAQLPRLPDNSHVVATHL